MADAGPALAPAPAPRPMGRLDRLFGVPPPPLFPPDGVPRLKRLREPERLYLAYAVLMSVAIAVVLEYLISAAPVPPGGDPGQWISSSYPWIHPTYPSQVIFLGYPPLVFPLLGILDLIGGGAIAAGQLYVGLGAILLGVSTYVFARSALHRPVLALLVEGFVLLNAPFMRLFFFGAYPTILALVFMNLAAAAFLRWMGSYRPRYLLLAWVLLGATLLTHSLVGLVAVGALAFSCLVLFLQRRLPKELLFSRAGFAGFLLFLGGVGGYYVGTHLLGIVHPNYLSQNPLGRSKTNLSQLLYPFHLGSLPGLFGHHPIFSGSESFGVAVAFSIILFFIIAYLAARQSLPTAALLQGSIILAVVGVGIVGWVLSVVTDYRRFAYLLYIPVTLAVAYIFDYLTGVFLAPGGVGAPPVAAPTALRPNRTARLDGVGIAIAIVGVAGLVFVGVGTTYPALAADETEYTGPPHSVAYLDAIGSINHDGRSGSVLTDNTASARWTRALTDRDTYANSEPTDFVFYGSQILDDEEALFAYQNLYGVSDGVTSATIPSLNATGFTEAPLYNVYREGIALPVLNFVPGSFEVTVHDIAKDRTISEPVLSSSSAPVFRFFRPGLASFSIVYAATNFTLVEIVESLPNADGFAFNFTASAAPGYGLAQLAGTIQVESGTVQRVGMPKGSVTSGTYQWDTVKNPGLVSGGEFTTNLSAVGGPMNTSFNPSSPSTVAATGGRLIKFVQNGTNLAPAASIEVEATTPSANNLINDLPPILSAPDIFENWSAAYLLLDHNGSGYLPHFQGLFGVTPLAAYSGWQVYVMPTAYARDPYGVP